MKKKKEICLCICKLFLAVFLMILLVTGVYGVYQLKMISDGEYSRSLLPYLNMEDRKKVYQYQMDGAKGLEPIALTEPGIEENDDPVDNEMIIKDGKGLISLVSDAGEDSIFEIFVEGTRFYVTKLIPAGYGISEIPVPEEKFQKLDSGQEFQKGKLVIHRYRDGEFLEDETLEIKVNIPAFHKEPEPEPVKQAGTEPAKQAATEQSDNCWHIGYNYVVDDGASSAPADGSLSQWKPGYYIAHDWSANGKRIAALGSGSKVEINGIYYQYVSQMSVELASTRYYDVINFANANNGIAFQTCIGNGWAVIKHLEPIG